MIVCGWCGQPTPDSERCASCSRDPVLPWTQRAMEPPSAPDEAGRPSLDAAAIRERYAAAKVALEARGQAVTVEALAEQTGVSPWTVARWRDRLGVR